MTGDPITDGGGDGDRSTQSLQFTYDFDDDELPSHAVVRAVAAIANESVLDLQPLYDVLDPDYLNEAFAGADDRTVTAELSFTYDGFGVTVTDEEVRVRKADDEN